MGNASYINTKSKKIMKSQRSLIIFHNLITSDQTRERYDFDLKKFRAYFRIRDFDSLLTIDVKKSQEMVEDYVFFLKGKNLRGNGIRSRMAGIKTFYYANDMILNWEKVFKMLKEERKSGNDKPYSRKDISELLENIKNFTHKTVILFLASSGCRVGAITELRLKDVTDFDNCKCVKVYANSKYEYHTFLTPEASDYLSKYLAIMKKKDMNPNNLVFPAKSRSYSTMISRISRQIRGEKIDNRYEIAGLHGLRKFFDTVLKSNIKINSNMAEKMMGHSTTFYLDNVYFKPTIESMFKEYQKAIPELTITDQYRLRYELNQKSEIIENLENQKDRKIQDLENRVSELYIHLNNIMPKILKEQEVILTDQI